MSKSPKTFWSDLVRDPLMHFLVLGGLLFVIGSWMDREENETILVTRDIITQKVEAHEQLLGRSFNAKERSNFVENLIEEEILVREAYRIGLERNDARIRKRLVDKMRFMLNEPIEDPTTEQLREYFQEHQDQYSTAESLTLIHAFFASEKADQISRHAPAILEKLRSGADHRMIGDPFLLGPELTERSKLDLMQLFGNESAIIIWSQPEGEWSGPIESTYGFHFVKVVERHPPQQQSFESMVMYLRQDWLFAKQREIHGPKIAERKLNYRIIIEPEVELK